jgi:hypothetical protein
LAAKAWTDYHLPAGQEAAFLKRVGPLLSEADHKRRLDRLLFNDSRWIGERNERAQYIRRMLPLLSADEKKKVEARLAVFTGAKNSSQLIAKLPAEAQAEWGVAMQMAQALRRQKKDEEAWKILLAEPVRPSPSSQTAGGTTGAPAPTRRSRRASPIWPTIWCAIPAACPTTPARMRPSWPGGWRCAICAMPNWPSATSRHWPIRPTGL